MSTYPGSPALGDEVKQRILTTYEQSLELAERGRRQEALLGCDFVLELDPAFAPARALKERLLAGDAPEESFGDLFDLESLDLDPPDLAGPEPPPPAPPDSGLGSELSERLAVRDYAGIVERAGREPEAVRADPELARIVETAQARLEAGPYVESFLNEAGTALRQGEPERARALLDKVRSLDPDHPRIADLEAMVRAAAPAAPEPSSPPPAPAAPAGAGEPLGDDRIAGLLAAGQAAADRGDYQEAIDSWSRIFLIDVDHEEAARRIEEARRLKAEREREVEEVFHEALAALEKGDREAARQGFERVLETQPNHLAARDYLRQMQSGEPVRLTPPGPSPDDTAALGSLGSFDLADLAAPRETDAAAGELKEEILVPPPPGAAAGEREPAAALPSYGRAAAPRREPGRRRFVLVGVLVLVLAVAAAALVLTYKDRWFPNSAVEEPVAREAGDAGAPGPVERATDLHQRGQTAMALGLLRRIRPDDPRYAEAQELVARWEAPAEPAEAAAQEETIPASLLERREHLLAAARTAFEEREHLLAAELLERADKMAALDGEHLERSEAAARQLAPLAREIELFREGEYELVLPGLWRLHHDQPANRDVRRMLVNSYHNRGVRQLQRGDPAGAAREFQEALAIAPDDRELQRNHLFARTYEQRSRDLLYRTYVKYLPLR